LKFGTNNDELYGNHKGSIREKEKWGRVREEGYFVQFGTLHFKPRALHF
jgi:hypothetical protein